MKAAGRAVASRGHYALLAAVFGLSLAWFGLGVERSGLASAEVDPVSHIPAQDESVYSHEAIQMATSGHWLTPVFMGRYILNKPPLFQWLAALSVRVSGISAWALRVPSLVAASAATLLVFWIVWRRHSLPAAAAGAVLIASSHFFYVFSRLAMTDMLLAFWITAALCVVLRDPRLGRGSSLGLFAAVSGAAILTKAAAGILPLVALALHAAIAPPGLRPRFRRVLAASALAAAIALPWHLYQIAVHPRWFVAEYILMQHFAVGLSAPPQYSSENHLLFYARRLVAIDPVLSLAALVSLPGLLRVWRKHSALLAWPAALVLALFAFRYRSAYYIVPLLPVLAILAAEALGRAPWRVTGAIAAGLVACAGIKAADPAAPWGIPAGVTSARAAAPALEAYCAQHRANELIVIAGDDQFYASDLPLYRLRYCFFEKRQTGAPRSPVDFAGLGIDVTVAEFNRLDALLPVWRKRLADFGLPSVAPIATVVAATSSQDVRDLIAAHPQTDFWIPARLLRSLDLKLAQQVKPDGAGGMFLLARQSASFAATRPCHL